MSNIALPARPPKPHPAFLQVASFNILQEVTMPAVSVLVASYNYRTYLGQTLDSLLAQTWQDMEVLVIDDGSTDGSLELAAEYAARDPRLRLLRHPDGGNHGLPATLVRGLAEARGEWTAFLESDDIWQPDCLQRRMQTLAAYEGTPGRNEDAGGHVQASREQTGRGQTGREQTETARESAPPSERVDLILNDIEPLPMPGAGTAWFDAYVGRVMREHATAARAASLPRPDAQPDMQGDARPNAQPEAQPDARPDARPDVRPDARPNARPNARSGNPGDPPLVPSTESDAAGGAWRIGSALLTENKIPTFSCVQVRTDVLRSCSFDSPVPRWLDWWLWIQLAQRPCLFVPQKSTIWRLHAGSQHHGVSPRAYLRDQRALWLGLRGLHLHTDAAGQRLLRQPWWAHLVARLALFVREHGLLGTLRRVGARLRPSR